MKYINLDELLHIVQKGACETEAVPATIIEVKTFPIARKTTDKEEPKPYLVPAIPFHSYFIFIYLAPAFHKPIHCVFGIRIKAICRPIAKAATISYWIDSIPNIVN